MTPLPIVGMSCRRCHKLECECKYSIQQQDAIDKAWLELEAWRGIYRPGEKGLKHVS